MKKFKRRVNMKHGKFIFILVLGLFAIILLGSQPVPALAAAQAGNLDQCRNGGIANPQTFTQCTGSAWVNGNAGAQNSHYREGESITYRAAVTGLNAGDNVVLILGYDVIHSNKYAVDYLTSNNRWQAPETSAGVTPDVPCSGVSPCVGPTLVSIPTPPGSIHADPTKTFASGLCIGTANSGSGPLQPVSSFSALPAAERQMAFYNVSGSPSISYFGTPPDFTAPGGGGDQEQQIQLSFVAGGSQVEISWGGHIASRLDWGCADGPLSAGGISGSPYHMRLKDMMVNGVHVNLGNQDRSLSAAAVLVPPSITLSKTPSTTEVCNSSNTQVTYTYVVNNTGGIAVSGSVVDDNGTPGNTADDVNIGTFNNLAAGASQTFTHAFTINGTKTNIATATATTSQNLSTTASASATVNGHVCTISLTKTPSVTNICNLANSSVTYTYVVKNTGDFFNVSGSISDDVLGSIGSFGPLAPGASATLTKSAMISSTVTNTATANGTFDDASSTTASATATATVTAVSCAQITPTNTTCSDFAGGTAATLSLLQYSVKGGLINSVAPGVFFYWDAVSAQAGSNTFYVRQAITTGNFDSHFFAMAAGSNVFDSNCVAVSGDTLTQNGSDIAITFNAASAGTYFLGIKFDATSVKGFAVPSPTTVHYEFSTLDSSFAILTGSVQGLDLAKK